LIPADWHGLTTDSENSIDSVRVPLPRVLRWFWIGSVIAFALTLLVSYLEFRAGMNRYRWIPFDTPYFRDLIEDIPTFRLLHTATFFNSTNSSHVAYPPFGAVQLGFLYSSGHPVIFFLVLAIVALVLAVWGVAQALVENGIGRRTAILFPLTLVLVSFPVERLIVQGNNEIFLWIFAAAGAWAYVRDHDDAAAVFWGLAAASKLYPAALLLLLLPRRKFRAFTVGMFVFVGVSVLSMMYLGPNIAVAWKGSLQNVFGYQQFRAAEISTRELHANHSLFVLVKLAAAIFGVSALKLVKLYYVCGGLLFVAVFFGRLRKMPVANQLLGVSVFMLTLPTISYFHTLVNLYAPLLVLFFVAIRADRMGVRIPGLSTAILLFLPLFASFQLFTFPSIFLFCGIVQVIVLLILFLYALQYPFAEPTAGERTKAIA
jgi:glycosyl transferase family 87